MKRVIQVYKAPHQWLNSPPGLGDFIRGACHLFEILDANGIEFRIDISQTEFADLIQQDESVFQIGDENRIANAEEYFVDHGLLHNRLQTFLASEETDLYICTNFGAWNRLSLPENNRQFIKKFYYFVEDIEHQTTLALNTADYEVLSVRCGDPFYSDPNGRVGNDLKRLIFDIVEQQILPRAHSPLVVTSDCYEMKVELAERYGMLGLPHRSQHGAFGKARPVVMDLCLLKNSRFNYHINSWAAWWSGFSHYTSIIFNIPSMNFRAPDFFKEEISAQGELITVEKQTNMPTNSKNALSNLYKTKCGRVADKWESYLHYYDRLFDEFRQQPIKFMEIGVQNGGSLEIWSKYFENAELLIGCDIDENCAKLKYEDARIHVVVGDINSIESFNKINLLTNELDIIIDDGSHVSIDILNAFINYFPRLKPGGIYVIEDMHTSYSSTYGGGILNENSAYAFFKKMIDIINYEFWQDKIDLKIYLESFFKNAPIPQFISDGWIDSIEFRNSIVTVRKSCQGTHQKLGNRVLVGTVAEVQDWGGVHGFSKSEL